MTRVKCSWEMPCQNCTARDQEAACKFRGPRDGPQPGTHHGETNPGNVMRQRIDHLEDLVKKLISDRQLVPPSSTGVVWTPESPRPGVVRALSAEPSDVSDGVRFEKMVMIDGSQSVY